MVQIRHTLEIPDSEFEFTYSRSGGPGGQHVNKVNSRVTLWFDLEETPYLSESQKSRVRERLSGRISGEGRLHISSQQSRSQSANREAALRRFAQLIAEALEETPPRRPTRTPRAARENRLAEKKRRSRVKRSRGQQRSEED